MPTYDYKCGDCNYQFEEFQSITASPLTECPKCHGLVQRLISAGNGLIFKGSGFYITDYKNNNGKAETKPEANKTEKSTKPDTDTSK
ncbi:MAG: FmdB family zinc ribbon protein [bacterium]